MRLRLVLASEAIWNKVSYIVLESGQCITEIIHCHFQYPYHHIKKCLQRMKILFKMFLVLLTSQLYAQKYSYSDYYKMINNAEVALVNNDLQEAALLFDSAFTMDLKPFGKDIYNAVVCNLEIDSFSKVSKYCEKLFYYGTPLSFLTHKKFDKLTQSRYWADIKKMYKSCGKFQSFDNSLKKEFEKRFKKDQLVNDIRRREYFYDNMKWIKTLISQNKFPSEKMLGISIDEDLGIVSNIKLEMLIFHWSAVDKNDTLNMIPLLEEQVRNGELHPTSYAILEYQKIPTISKLRNFAYLIIGESILTPQFTLEELAKVNEARLKMGLHSFEDYKKITKFAYNDDRFIFNNNRIMQLSENFSKKIFLNNGFVITDEFKVK